MTDKLTQALNRLTKWRAVFAAWQLGNRPKGDPECDAVRDHRESSILLRAEANAMLGLLVKKGVFTEAEWEDALGVEAALLSADYEKRFPGAQAIDDGIAYGQRAQEWMSKWER